MRQKITVTQEIIDAGKKYDPFRCPIALALQVHFPEAGVGLVGWTRRPNLPTRDTLLPKNVQTFIKNFDEDADRSKIKPFSFYVEVTV